MTGTEKKLLIACESGDADAVAFLLENGVAVDVRNEFGFTPLHFACKHDHVAIFRLLLSHGADPLARNDYDRTPVEGIKDLAKREEIERAMQRYIEDKITSSPSGI